MKSRDEIRASTLSFLRSAISSAAIEKRKKNLDDAQVIGVIKKQVKTHQDSIEQFKKGNRADLVEKETKELQILKSYLPAELPAEELKKIIEDVIAQTGAATMKEMGRVMKEVMAKVGNQADGKTLSGLVKERLSKKEE